MKYKVISITNDVKTQVAIRQYINQHNDKYRLAMQTANAADALYMADEISPQIIIVKDGLTFYNAQSLMQDMREKLPAIQYILIIPPGGRAKEGDFTDSVSASVFEDALTSDVIGQTLDSAAINYEKKLSLDASRSSAFPLQLDQRELNWITHNNLFARILNETADPAQLFTEFPGLSTDTCSILIGESSRNDGSFFSYYQDISLMGKLYQQLNALINQHSGGTVFITSERKICFLLNPLQIGEENNDDAPVADFARKANDILLRLNYPPLTFTWGPAKQELRDLHSNYRDIDAILKYHFFFSDIPVLSQAHLEINSHKLDSEKLEQHLETLNRAFRDSNLTLLKESLDEIHMDTSQTLSFNSFHYVWSQLTLVYMLLAQKYGLRLEESFLHLQEEVFPNIDDAFQSLSRCFVQLFNDLPYMQIDTENQHIRNAISYILAHIREDTNLAAVAKGIHISSSYLSHLFQREFAMTYVDYNHQLRIHYAAKMMTQTTKIYQIATEVGFENSKYFSKVFKKVMGRSPLDYRKSLTLIDVKQSMVKQDESDIFG